MGVFGGKHYQLTPNCVSNSRSIFAKYMEAMPATGKKVKIRALHDQLFNLARN
jgi:hypothetical protein